MDWLWWLSAPVIATVLAACWAWLRSRPARVRTTDEAMAEHGDYLDALVQTARSRDRGLRSDDVPAAPAEAGHPDDAAA